MTTQTTMVSRAVLVMVSRADGEGLGAQHVGEALRVGGPDQQSSVLQKVADADGSDQHGQRGGGAQRLVGQPLNDDAQQGADDDCQQDRGQGVPAQIIVGAEGHIAAHHDDIAVGEVQHLGDAVNHCVAQCDDGVYAAQADAVDQIG